MTCESSAKLQRWYRNAKFGSAACAIGIRARASPIRRVGARERVENAELAAIS